MGRKEILPLVYTDRATRDKDVINGYFLDVFASFFVWLFKGNEAAATKQAASDAELYKKLKK